MRAEDWKQIVLNHQYSCLLIPSDGLVIEIQTEHYRLFIRLTKEQADIITDYNDRVHCLIQGNEQYIRKIITGDIKLQDAIQFQQVQVQCSFRHLLLLESIFYLNKKAG